MSDTTTEDFLPLGHHVCTMCELLLKNFIRKHSDKDWYSQSKLRVAMPYYAQKSIGEYFRGCFNFKMANLPDTYFSIPIIPHYENSIIVFHIDAVEMNISEAVEKIGLRDPKQKT